ncbi:hypothetical protein J2S21_002786 [Peribacillus cavernae]|nr:hypothetical protein [Peribacillus cavernae]
MGNGFTQHNLELSLFQFSGNKMLENDKAYN